MTIDQKQNKTERDLLDQLKLVENVTSSKLNSSKELKTGEFIEHFSTVKNVSELSILLNLLNNFNYREFTPKILNLEEVMKGLGLGETGILRIHFILREGN